MRIVPQTKKNRMVFLPLLIFAGVLTIVPLVMASLVHGQDTPQITANLGFQNAVYPMEINVTSIQISTVGNHTTTIGLVAYNNLGIEPTYANAIASLQTLTLSVGYQYSTISGIQNGTFNVQPSVSLNLGPNQKTTFYVTISNFPEGSEGNVGLLITGGFTWQLTAQSQLTTVVNGSGQLSSYAQSVVFP